MADVDKEVLYLEADEEITSAIDKLLAMEGGRVSVVVPKRSTLLQSIVNQKLLKKAADDAGKELVLVTTDRTSSHLAGRVGIAVASSLKAEPSIPNTTAAQPSVANEIVEDEPVGAPPPPIESAPIEPVEAAPVAAAGGIIKRRPLAPDTPKAAAAKKSPKMPNFNNLQKRFLWGAGVLAVVLLIVLGNFLLKRATVTLFVQAQRVATDFDFSVDTQATKSDPSSGVVAGQKLENKKTLNQKFTATGKKDVGTKAQGQMTVYNGYDSSPRSFPSGSRFIAPDGKVFRSNGDFTVPGASVVAGSLSPGSTKVDVTADAAGDQYNLGPAKYSIPNQPPQVYGQGGQMSGGTSKQVTVVTQGDVDQARSAALEADKSDSIEELKKKADKGYTPLEASVKQSVTQATPSPGVDQEASQANLALDVAYTAVAVPDEDFAKMVEAQELKDLGEEKQIYDNGIKTAEITLKPGKEDQFNFSGEFYGGDKLDMALIAKELTGKRYGDATDYAGKQLGVQRADVAIWPSWSTKMPRITKNIKVEIKVEGVGD